MILVPWAVVVLTSPPRFVRTAIGWTSWLCLPPQGHWSTEPSRSVVTIARTLCPRLSPTGCTPGNVLTALLRADPRPESLLLIMYKGAARRRKPPTRRTSSQPRRLAFEIRGEPVVHAVVDGVPDLPGRLVAPGGGDFRGGVPHPARELGPGRQFPGRRFGPCSGATPGRRCRGSGARAGERELGQLLDQTSDLVLGWGRCVGIGRRNAHPRISASGMAARTFCSLARIMRTRDSSSDFSSRTRWDRGETVNVENGMSCRCLRA